MMRSAQRWRAECVRVQRMMDREAKRAAILAIAAGAFGAGLFGYTVATAKPSPESAPSAPESKGGGPGEGAQASCGGPNGCEGQK
jgi:hypothetical protein